MKRFFILICLIFACSVGVFGTSFGDQEKISNKAAVTMLADLGIFNGYEDGNFYPSNVISRAEIAKVMAILDNKDASTTGGQTFTDTVNLWATPYIEYCVGEGIISSSATQFRPNDPITGYELSKMVLVILGYDETQFEGQGWTENIDKIGEKINLFAGLTKNLKQYCTRENAALIINNALQCQVIASYDEDNQPIYYYDDMYNPRSLIEIRYGAALVVGVLTANSVHDLRTEKAVATADLDYFIHIDGYTKDFRVSEDLATDNSLLGKKIVVYAIFGTNYNWIVGTATTAAGATSATYQNLDTLALVLRTSKLQITEETNIYKNYVPISIEEYMEEIQAGCTITVVENQGDKVLDYIFLHVTEEEEIAE